VITTLTEEDAMYRPHKRKLVRRAATGTFVAVLATAGLGVTLLHQTSASLALRASLKKDATTATTGAEETSVRPLYSLVGVRDDDSTS
jgi:hypothetical protein